MACAVSRHAFSVPKVVPVLAANLKRNRGRGAPVLAARITMSPEQQIQQAQCRIQPNDIMMSEATQLDSIAAQLMAVQRHWSAPSRAENLNEALAASRNVWQGIQTALAEGALPLPLEVQHNLLILSVYADCKINACEGKNPSADMLGSLISLTRTLAGSLKEWRAAA